MGYMHKVTIYGKYIQTTEYAKEISTERVCPSAFFKERVRNPFAKRRLDNVRKSKRLFVQRVLCGLGSLGTPLFITLTYAENFGDVGLGNRHLRLFFQRLRKSHKGLEYVAVPEYQERGALHYHILLFGAPLEWGDVYSKTAFTTYRGIKRKKIISWEEVMKVDKEFFTKAKEHGVWYETVENLLINLVAKEGVHRRRTFTKIKKAKDLGQQPSATMDHPDTSDETTNVETVQDLIHFAFLFGLAKGAKDKQEEIRKVLGMPL